MLCPACEFLKRHHHFNDGTACTSGVLRGFNDCLDEEAAQRISILPDTDFLMLLSTADLSNTFTTGQAQMIKNRLKQIIRSIEESKVA